MLFRKYGEKGLPNNSINLKMTGSAGQSFCAFMTNGIHVTLEGDANDYVGKVRFFPDFEQYIAMVSEFFFNFVNRLVNWSLESVQR